MNGSSKTVNLADCYAKLQLNHQASADDIKTAYRRLARQYHPDLNPSDRTAERRFKEINAAYEALCDRQQDQDAPPHAYRSSSQRSAPHRNAAYETFVRAFGG